MPRLEFTSRDDLVNWVSARMDPKKYECYLTTSGEVILVPTVSTRPIVYAYFMCPTMDVATDVTSMLKQRGVPVFRVGKFEWREDTRIAQSI